MESKNFTRGGFTVKITYFPEKKSELDQLKKVDEIKELFGMIFCVGNRKLTVGEYSHDYIGEYQDILQISVEFDYLENTSKEVTEPIAETIEARITERR